MPAALAIFGGVSDGPVAQPRIFDALRDRSTVRSVELLYRGPPQTLSERRKALEDLVAGHDRMYAARRLDADGLAAWQTVTARGYEGLVAKLERAPYDPQRTQWLKVKVRREGRFVIGGVIAREDLRALLVGERDGPRSGTAAWSSTRRSPARCRAARAWPHPRLVAGAVWLKPVLQAEVTYAEVMQGRLRDPVFRKLRLAR